MDTSPFLSLLLMSGSHWIKSKTVCYFATIPQTLKIRTIINLNLNYHFSLTLKTRYFHFYLMKN